VEIHLGVVKICLVIGQKYVQITGHQPDIGDFRRQIGSNDTDLDDSSISLARLNLQLGSENIDLGDIHPDLRRRDLHLVESRTEHCPINLDLADFRFQFLNARDQLGNVRVECVNFQDDVEHFNIEIGHFNLEVGHFNLEVGYVQEKNQVGSVRTGGQHLLHHPDRRRSGCMSSRPTPNAVRGSGEPALSERSESKGI
jgi:hypothetical protein